MLNTELVVVEVVVVLHSFISGGGGGAGGFRTRQDLRGPDRLADGYFGWRL